MEMYGFEPYVYGGGGVQGLLNGGKVWFVKPGTGSDSNSGKRPNQAVKTLSKVLSLMSADKNDVAVMISEDNSASGTTDYQSATLDWNKDGTHLVGVNSGSMFGQRSRIAQLSTATSIDPLVTWSASNASMRGIHIFQGVDDNASVTAMNVTGERNSFINCHIAGIGHDTQDVAAARTLKVTGGAENWFYRCVIGLDTISRGTATSEIEFASQATRNIFEECIFPTFAGAAGFTFIDFDAASTLDRFQLFRKCSFINAVNSTATAMTEAVDSHASAGGMVVFEDCNLVGVTSGQHDAGSVGNVYVNSPAPAANGDGGWSEPVD